MIATSLIDFCVSFATFNGPGSLFLGVKRIECDENLTTELVAGGRFNLQSQLDAFALLFVEMAEKIGVGDGDAGIHLMLMPLSKSFERELWLACPRPDIVFCGQRCIGEEVIPVAVRRGDMRSWPRERTQALRTWAENRIVAGRRTIWDPLLVNMMRIRMSA